LIADCGLRIDCGLGLWILYPPWQAECINRDWRATVILTIVFVCLLLWFIGLMTSYTLGGVLHILLVVAIVLFLVHIIQGNSIGNA
jgi:hypothetical protein